jgi:hypothetical protein
MFCFVTTYLTLAYILVYLCGFGQHMRGEFELGVENGRGSHESF